MSIFNLQSPLVTLTTDFGVGSSYPAQMKAEILRRRRDAAIVDITHGITPQSIVQGAITLDDVARRFPEGTLHIAVIDPGVGTSRRLLYAEIAGQHYLAPDNGLLSLAAERSAPTLLIELRERRFWNDDVSNTFHGRDILAPVAGHLLLGIDPRELGLSTTTLLPLTLPQPTYQTDRAVGCVLMADSFGNLITNLTRDRLAALGPLDRLRVECGSLSDLAIHPTYGAVSSGEPLALFDSQGRLEIAMSSGNAAMFSGVKEGMDVIVGRVD